MNHAIPLRRLPAWAVANISAMLFMLVVSLLWHPFPMPQVWVLIVVGDSLSLLAIISALVTARSAAPPPPSATTATTLAPGPNAAVEANRRITEIRALAREAVARFDQATAPPPAQPTAAAVVPAPRWLQIMALASAICSLLNTAVMVCTDPFPLLRLVFVGILLFVALHLLYGLRPSAA